MQQSRLHLKNVGVLPAKMEGGVVSCVRDGFQGGRNFTEKNIAGNGETLIFDFHISTSTEVSCDFLTNYSTPAVGGFKDDFHTTKYKFISSDGKLLPVDADLK
jgi:hypothetical protein